MPTTALTRSPLAEALNRYTHLLYDIARPLGLTSLTKQGAEEQVIRSVLLEKVVGNPSTLVDVGTGAGLPGIPLILSRLYSNAGPDHPFRAILVEPKRKAIAFLEKVIRVLELEDVEIVALTAQDAAKRGLSGAADVVVAKALARPSLALDLCAPLCRSNGKIVVTSSPGTGSAGATHPDLSAPEYFDLASGAIHQTVNVWLKA